MNGVGTIALLAAGLVVAAVATTTAGPPAKEAATKVIREPVPDLGANADLHGKAVFPADDPWNLDVSKAPIDPDSDALVAGIGANKPLHPDFGAPRGGAPSGIPYVVVVGTQPKVPVRLTSYPDESDKGPFPVPADAPIEGGPKGDGDRHVLVIDRDHWILHELDNAFPEAGGWRTNCAAVFNLKTNTRRPAGWTSADAAGLPIFPGLVRYDEAVGRGEIKHALRFTVVKTRRAYVAPARHWASRSDDRRLPPMGMRVRLKAGFDSTRFPAPARVILAALKTYGMIVADNGGDWFVSGAPDPRWDDDALHALTKVKGKDFEVVRMANVVGGR